VRGSEKLSENVVLVRSDEEFRPPRKSVKAGFKLTHYRQLRAYPKTIISK